MSHTTQLSRGLRFAGVCLAAGFSVFLAGTAAVQAEFPVPVGVLTTENEPDGEQVATSTGVAPSVDACVPVPACGEIDVRFGLLFLQPTSNNLRYAVFVSGTQPFFQSWYYQEIDPDYSPAFEIGGTWVRPGSLFDLSVDWTHLDTSDSAFKQASQTVDPFTVEFVAPQYDVGPAVFGIKRADSNVEFEFDSVRVDVGRRFLLGPAVRGRVFGGITILRIDQTLTTVYSDNAGSIATPISDATPPDPNFRFQDQNVSEYLGVGPELGLNIECRSRFGLGIVGQALGTITAGSLRVRDNFTSRSTRLINMGVPVSNQFIDSPDSTQVVPGFDSRLGLSYERGWQRMTIRIEAGYRYASYLNAISNVTPDSLVQIGLGTNLPQFASGTMAINSTTTRESSFNLNGPYGMLTCAFSY